jgi:hypothetical protein
MTKNISRWVRRGLPAVAVVVALAGCDSPSAGNPTADTENTETSEAGGSPEAEGSGPEPPRPPDDGKSVSYPNLPAGEDNNSNYDSSQMRQCMTVAWLGQMDVPDGISVRVTAVRIMPPGVFDLTGSGCDGVEACASFTFTAEDEPCSVSIEATATNGTRASLRLAGRCLPQGARECDELLADDGSPIKLYQPDPPQSDGTQEDPPPDEEQPSEEQPPSEEEESPPSPPTS